MAAVKKRDRHPEQQGWIQFSGETSLKMVFQVILPAVMDRLAVDSGLGVPVILTHSLRGKVGWVSAMGVNQDKRTYGLIAQVTFDKFGDDISYKIDTEFSGIDTFDIPKDVFNRALQYDYCSSTKSNLWRLEAAYRMAHPLEDGCTCTIISDSWKMIGCQVKLLSLKDKTVVPLDGQFQGTEIRLGGDMNKNLRRIVK